MFAELVQMKCLAVRCRLSVIVMARDSKFCLFKLDDHGNCPDSLFQRALELGYLAAAVIGVNSEGREEMETIPNADPQVIGQALDEFRQYAELERLGALVDPRT